MKIKIIKKLGKAIIATAPLIGFTANVHAAATESEMYYVLSDHLGTPEMLVDKDQHVVWKAEYDEFGKATILVEEVEFNLRLPGQYYDKETGTHYNYYRDYNPELGVFTQPDPIGILLNDISPTMEVAEDLGVIDIPYAYEGYINHSYGYVDQNPIVYTDPNGLANAIALFCTNPLGCGAAAAVTLCALDPACRAAAQNAAQACMSAFEDGLDDFANYQKEKEHTKNKRPSTKAKHEKGQGRKKKDGKGGEKGDVRRPY